MTYDELEKALRVFNLGERATLREIKSRHRRLAKRHHSDNGSDPDPRRMSEINAAYAVLIEYLESYRYCFSRQEFLEQNPEERLREQFARDGIWRG